MSKYCFLIPTYQHAFTLEPILAALQPFGFKTFVIDDGSDSHNRQELERLRGIYNFVEWLVHSENQGKGMALSTGLKAAAAQGFSHAIQIDSDGQHDLSKINELLRLSQENPQDVISGEPQYDDTVPRSRLYGRFLTHFWVWIETLSFQIRDSMCGFRIYPVMKTLEVFDKVNIGKRMDFDIEILVRLFWQGVGVRYLSVPVRYPENGISHFDVWKDNVRISKMHTKLVFGMLWRLPILIFRKAFPKKQETRWHRVEEVGSVLGIRVLLLIYRLLGRKGVSFLLYPVCLYYTYTGKTAREASLDYQKKLRDFTQGRAKPFSVLEHIYSFAESAVDKFAVWFGDIRGEDLDSDDVAELMKIANSPQGAFFITSHYGNIEICRAIGRFSGIRFNALVYHENAKKFNSYLGKVRPEAHLNLISVKDLGMEIAIHLKQKVENREWIFMVGDRQSVRENTRQMNIHLLGQEAKVSEGPFVLAYLLDAPVYVIHCYKQGLKFRIKVSPVTPDFPRASAHKGEWIKHLADRYAHELETTILQDPKQWYNFYNFWKTM